MRARQISAKEDVFLISSAVASPEGGPLLLNDAGATDPADRDGGGGRPGDGQHDASARPGVRADPGATSDRGRMNGPAATVSPPSAVEDAEAHAARPIAVVWCRQVDNEEESPGYTTIPEEFPGLRETVDTVRAVGHLAINVSDTHDYWDPDPGTSLSYYPNLFLYPAYRGEYTCIGRMFLSKEDRPRLGMKTLVLPTAELLQPEVYGATVLRWHASMGGLKKSASADPSPPESGLYDRVGEGFLFHRGSTDPVLLVASERWAATMQVLLELIKSLPAALTSLGGILAFPYFLPQARTDIKELQERIPLTLAVMRVPRTEASGPRYDRRLQSWETTSMTVRDLTSETLGPTGAKGKEVLPVVLQYVRDHNEDKLFAIRQRVDVVELPRQRAHLAEPEPQSGRARRKESWRIGTAMESAALLLQRSRGRQIPISGETAKRAQEYLSVTPAGWPRPVGMPRVPADSPRPSQLPANGRLRAPFYPRRSRSRRARTPPCSRRRPGPRCSGWPFRPMARCPPIRPSCNVSSGRRSSASSSTARAVPKRAPLPRPTRRSPPASRRWRLRSAPCPLNSRPVSRPPFGSTSSSSQRCGRSSSRRRPPRRRSCALRSLRPSPRRSTGGSAKRSSPNSRRPFGRKPSAPTARLWTRSSGPSPRCTNASRAPKRRPGPP